MCPTMANKYLINSDLFVKNFSSAQYFDSLAYCRRPDTVGIAHDPDNQGVYVAYSTDEYGAIDLRREFPSFSQAIDCAKEMYKGLIGYYRAIVFDHAGINKLQSKEQINPTPSSVLQNNTTQITHTDYPKPKIKKTGATCAGSKMPPSSKPGFKILKTSVASVTTRKSGRDKVVLRAGKAYKSKGSTSARGVIVVGMPEVNRASTHSKQRIVSIEQSSKYSTRAKLRKK